MASLKRGGIAANRQQQPTLSLIPPKAGIDLAGLKSSRPRVASIPFESEHKFMASIHDESSTGKRVIFVKGASDRLMPLCKTQIAGDDLGKTAALDHKFWDKAQADLSAQGLRVLALCRCARGGVVGGWWRLADWGLCRMLPVLLRGHLLRVCARLNANRPTNSTNSNQLHPPHRGELSKSEDLNKLNADTLQVRH